jgi:chemotaxis-related protein WspB
MLFAVFHIGDSSYAVDAAQIVEVLPLLRISPVPHAPQGIAGLCNYHGEFIPVLDVSVLATGAPSPSLVSTRMLLTRQTSDGSGSFLVALLVPGATDAVRLEPCEFTSSGLSIGGEWLGPVAPHRDGVLRRVDVNALLTPAVRSALVGSREAVS